MRRDLVDYLDALGVAQGKSKVKAIPEGIFAAPEEAVTAFLRGLFDADDCVVSQVGKGTRYVGLAAGPTTSSEVIKRFSARSASGDASTARATRRARSAAFARTG